MTERPAYERLIATGRLDRIHELTLMRVAALWKGRDGAGALAQRFRAFHQEIGETDCGEAVLLTMRHADRHMWYWQTVDDGQIERVCIAAKAALAAYP